MDIPIPSTLCSFFSSNIYLVPTVWGAEDMADMVPLFTWADVQVEKTSNKQKKKKQNNVL